MVKQTRVKDPPRTKINGYTVNVIIHHPNQKISNHQHFLSNSLVSVRGPCRLSISVFCLHRDADPEDCLSAKTQAHYVNMPLRIRSHHIAHSRLYHIDWYLGEKDFRKQCNLGAPHTHCIQDGRSFDNNWFIGEIRIAFESMILIGISLARNVKVLLLIWEIVGRMKFIWEKARNVAWWMIIEFRVCICDQTKIWIDLYLN